MEWLSIWNRLFLFVLQQNCDYTFVEHLSVLFIFQDVNVSHDFYHRNGNLRKKLVNKHVRSKSINWIHLSTFLLEFEFICQTWIISIYANTVHSLIMIMLDVVKFKYVWENIFKNLFRNLGALTCGLIVNQSKTISMTEMSF